MLWSITLYRMSAVVPRKGDVDRNKLWCAYSPAGLVVPRKGDVDRNHELRLAFRFRPVVPRKGDVDRNRMCLTWCTICAASSPARGTWIEMLSSRTFANQPSSSPARGTWIEIPCVHFGAASGLSSPARGTWIEMPLPTQILDRWPVVPRKGDVDRNNNLLNSIRNVAVVPRKGDVDRNTFIQLELCPGQRRPPQGGRG